MSIRISNGTFPGTLCTGWSHDADRAVRLQTRQQTINEQMPNQSEIPVRRHPLAPVARFLIKLIANLSKLGCYVFHWVFPKKRFQLPSHSKALLPARRARRIPRILWQTNFTDRITLPVYLNYLFNRLMAPTFEYRFMLTDARAAFVDTDCPGALAAAYHRLQIGASQADFWRVLVLQRYGGVYLDIDAHLVWPLGWIIPPDQEALYLRIKTGEISNYFIASAPGNPDLEAIALQILHNIETRSSENVYDLTGPGVFNAVLDKALVAQSYYKDTCNQGNFTNEYFQYIDKPQGKWNKEQQQTPLIQEESNKQAPTFKPTSRKDSPQSIKTYVISLKSDIERRQSITQELGKFPLEWEFIDAVDGKSFGQLPSEYDQAKRTKEYGDNLSKGEIACFLSHRFAWKKCKGDQQPCLILEDDAKLEDNLMKALSLALTLINQWDIFRLKGGTDRHLITIERGRSKEFRIVEELRDPSTAVAYILTPFGAKKLLDQSNRFHVPVDNFIEFRHINKLRILSIRPYPVTADHFETSIGDRETHQKRTIKRLRRSIFRESRKIRKRIWQLRRLGKIYVAGKILL